VYSGTNLVYHAAGWLEGGLIASPEKLVMDCEILQMIQRYCDPELIQTRSEDIAIDAIKTVGPNGHYFGVEHTQERYETAFYSPIASDWSNYEAWELNGASWTAERAHTIYKNILAEFTPPPIDTEVTEKLQEFVTKRKEQGGVSTDF
jgi:trimethylamine--corrinoid protein Co-methyltransferase